MSRPTSTAYKTKNWPAYNEALKRRGSLTIWFDPSMIWEAAPTGKRGRQPDYSEAAIQTLLTMKVLFGMALRQTTGFVESLPAAADRPRLGDAELQHPQPLPEDPEGQHPVSRIARATAPADRQHRDQGRRRRGVERPQARRHETPRLAQDPHPLPGRRMEQSPRGGIDEQTLEIRAAECTTSDAGDAPMLPELLDQIPLEQVIASVTADDAFDTRKCHYAIAARGAAAVIPPRKNAKPWKPTPPGRLHATKPCAHRNALAEPSGDDGAVITAGAASKPRCTV
jgi:hypothetical protein